jgi:hypothetical protein
MYGLPNHPAVSRLIGRAALRGLASDTNDTKSMVGDILAIPGRRMVTCLTTVKEREGNTACPHSLE